MASLCQVLDYMKIPGFKYSRSSAFIADPCLQARLLLNELFSQPVEAGQCLDFVIRELVRGFLVLLPLYELIDEVLVLHRIPNVDPNITLGLGVFQHVHQAALAGGRRLVQGFL